MAIEFRKIIEAVLDQRIWITDHADEEAENDDLTFEEIYFSVIYGEILEEYPNNFPYPRCLIFGTTFANEPVHTIWDYDEETQTATLVTVYRPDSRRWINFKTRR
ncbi:MAG: DUF4258 domain-containing protein [Jaaginema sp. PMC 1079.18]|nr:DUF4258 domain-containing protein [Jaaginema sp. PMC 1080.18]MEC4853130.1 DUF4258 domain-containing protein [Jaaginema sp. PMC 1079.18]MEC4868156.1 DUF4258 domain-containing protein [Jaaginema sp. PMC 1078.18]